MNFQIKMNDKKGCARERWCGLVSHRQSCSFCHYQIQAHDTAASLVAWLHSRIVGAGASHLQSVLKSDPTNSDVPLDTGSHNQATTAELNLELQLRTNVTELNNF